MWIDLQRYIDRMLTLSTAHITERVAKRLGNPKDVLRDSGIVIADWFDHGWIIYCSEDAADVAREEDAFELSRLIQLCVDHHIAYLKLDSDGSEIPGLPTWSW